MGAYEPGTAKPVAGDPHEAYLGDLAGYVFGALDGRETETVEQHLSACAICRAELPLLRAALADMSAVPSEAFIDGPPEDADLLVRRTMRRIADESARPAAGSKREFAVAAVAAAAAIVAGVVIGRGTAPHPAAAPTSAVTTPSTSVSPVPGTKAFSVSDATTGARLTGNVIPAQGWVRVSVAAAGIPKGQRCVLLVVPKQGRPVQAGSWVVSAAGARVGTALQGAALVPMDQIAAIEVINTAGRVFVDAQV
jgi:hypothetical protein